MDATWSLGGTYKPSGRESRDASKKEASWDDGARRGIQNALVWSGDYVSRIDGEFGRGTRRAIRLFQMRNGFAPTGYLIFLQIVRLERIRQERVNATGFQVVTDMDAGVQIGIPTAFFPPSLATIDHYSFTKEYPGAPGFTAGILYLVSAKIGHGDMQVMFDAFSSMEIFPFDAYRVYRDDWFVISAARTDVSVYGYVRRFGSEAKGFMLFWPAVEDHLYSPLSVAMFNSLENLPGLTLDGKQIAADLAPTPFDDPEATDPSSVTTTPAASPEPAINTGATGTGFYVNSEGYLVTNEHVIGECSRSFSADGEPAAVVVADKVRDLAVLLVPSRAGAQPYVSFASRPVELNADVTAIGFPLQGVIQGINVTRGSVSETFWLQW